MLDSLDWLQAQPHWAAALVFILAFAESVALIGIIVPGVLILFGIGALIGLGLLDFQTMVISAFLGAVLGDGFSFWLGQHYRERLGQIWPFKNQPQLLQSGRAFFQKHGDKSVLIGRFFGPMRAVIPLVAGMMHMPRHRFLIANILSALLWAPAYLLPGMVFGASLEIASEVAWRLALALLLLLFGLWFLLWLLRHLFLWMQPQALCQRWLRRPCRDELAHLLFAAGFGLLLLLLLPKAVFSIADQSLAIIAQQLRGWDSIMLALSAMAGQTVILALILVIALLLHILQDRWLKPWLWTSIGLWFISVLMEGILRQYPVLIPLLPDIFVLRASALFSLIALLIQHRPWTHIIAGLLILMVSGAQLYWGSSLWAVGSALSLGLIWSSLALIWQPAPQTLRAAKPIAYSSLLLIAAAVILTPPPPARPAEIPQGEMTRSEWLQGGWQKLDAYRSDVFHSKDHPFNVQMDLSLSLLEQQLKQQGWQRAEWQFLDLLRLFYLGHHLNYLPVLPHSHRGRWQKLALYKPLGQYRLVLYIWPSRFYNKNQRPFWLAELSLQAGKKRLGLIQYPISLKDKSTALSQFKQDLRLPFVERLNGQLILVYDRLE